MSTMSQPPEFYLKMKEQFPEVMEAYETLGNAARRSGPLDGKTLALTKLALSMGAGMEGATHSSVRKALAAGCAPEEIQHVVVLAVTTLGFPTMMRARAWVEDVLSQKS